MARVVHLVPHRDCGAEVRLQIFFISRTGLLAITIAVCALWACIGMEKVMVKRANLEARRTFHQIERLRRPATAVPVQSPAAAPFARRHASVG